jgi:hypothetical protein
VPSRGSSGSSIRPARLPLRNSSSKPPFQILGHSIPIHKHRNLLAHAPQRLHEEVSAADNDMIYATSAAEIEAYRRAFIRKWRLKCKAVADSLEEAGDRLFHLHPVPVSQLVSPVELTKLGVIERFQKLGLLRYILIASLVFLVFGESKFFGIINTNLA